MMRTGRPSDVVKRRGAVLVLMALVLPVVLVLCFMAVNVAYMLLLRSELRVATDASARAAGSTFSYTNDEDAATIAAQQIALLNTVGGQGLVVPDADVEYGVSTQPSPGAKYQFVVGGLQKNAARVTATPAPRDLFAAGLFVGSTFSPTQSATATYTNVDICLVLDRSSSMKLDTDENGALLPAGDERACEEPDEDSRWVAVEEAVEEFVTVLQNTIPVEHVAVVTYGSDYTMNCGSTINNLAVTIDSPLSGNLNNVNNAIDVRSAAVWGGMTEIHSGIQGGTAVLTGPGARPNARKVMIVLTDGNYTADDPVPYAAIAQSYGIRVHAVTFSEGANQVDMQDVAAAGGGDFYHAPDPDTLNDIFRKLAAMPVMLTD